MIEMIKMIKMIKGIKIIKNTTVRQDIRHLPEAIQHLAEVI